MLIYPGVLKKIKKYRTEVNIRYLYLYIVCTGIYKLYYYYSDTTSDLYIIILLLLQTHYNKIKRNKTTLYSEQWPLRVRRSHRNGMDPGIGDGWTRPRINLLVVGFLSHLNPLMTYGYWWPEMSLCTWWMICLIKTDVNVTVKYFILNELLKRAKSCQLKMCQCYKNTTEHFSSCIYCHN